jgi:hypothetical protein
VLDFTKFPVKLGCDCSGMSIVDHSLQVVFMDKQDLLVQHIVLGAVLVDRVNQVWKD